MTLTVLMPQVTLGTSGIAAVHTVGVNTIHNLTSGQSNFYDIVDFHRHREPSADPVAAWP